ncbi:MAG: CocE/NonD family hydrolase [Actinobacteria bacterium]|nr:CocE/NonD family hydrolase [Actinomycetota bacterium]
MASGDVLGYFWSGVKPEEGGYPGFSRRTEIKDGIIGHYDVAVPMRDGKKIYVDIFRPEAPGQYPGLIAWSPYGKHGVTKYAYFPRCGVADADLSEGTIFEGPQPGYWCPNGYVVINVDSRGAWNSEGDLTFMTEQEGQDGYDLIEWAAEQEWCNGRLALVGVSYLAWSQWRIASTNPPHLAAINPWEGVSDFYRELGYHGGIPETFFTAGLKNFMSYTNTRVEDIAGLISEHPLFDAFWESKNADLSRITAPAFVVASWSDHGLHTRGTLEGFKQISSAQKWLLVHGRKKWQFFYEQADMQKQFLDKFLKGLKTEVDYWPPVRFEVRDRYYWGCFLSENEWPVARTEYKELYLDASDGTMNRAPVAARGQARYRVDDPADNPADNPTDTTQNAQFTAVFQEPVELTGHMKLKLWVKAEGSDDMDLFVALEKIDRAGNVVHFPFFNCWEDGPVALGWLRVSHREIDEAMSTRYQPFHPHNREVKLRAGEVVPVEIEIWPSSTIFHEGESLRVIVQGSDIYYHPNQWPTNAHQASVNRGEHVIYTGGEYDSHLLVPVVPTT